MASNGIRTVFMTSEVEIKQWSWGKLVSWGDAVQAAGRQALAALGGGVPAVCTKTWQAFAKTVRRTNSEAIGQARGEGQCERSKNARTAGGMTLVPQPR